MTLEVVTLSERHGTGAVETLVRVAAPEHGPAVVLPVHPNGAAVLEALLYVPNHPPNLASLAARGRAFVADVAGRFRDASRTFATGPILVDDESAIRRLAVLRVTSTGYQYEPSRRSDLAAEARSDPKARDAYAAALPLVHLCRCPFTGDLLSVPIDEAALDGPYWDFQDPVHPIMGDVPSTFLGYAGGMRLANALEDTPYVCVPGPEVPVVAPHLLMQPAVKAVITAVWVGRHTGFVTSYFAEPGSDVPEPWVARWGAKDYEVPRAPARDFRTPMPPVLDGELAPWLATGKLAWVEPHDRTLTSRSGVDDCPWLGIPGSTTLQAIQHGRRLT